MDDLTLEKKDGRWYIVTPRGTKIKTAFLDTLLEEHVISFFWNRYRMYISRQQSLPLEYKELGQ